VCNVGPKQHRMEGQNKIEEVKLNVPPFKGRSDLDAYLDCEMKSMYSPAMIILKNRR